MLIKGKPIQKKNIHSVLIIQLGDIGDVVWSTPVLWRLKEAYPDARLSILLRESFGSLLEGEPVLHKIFAIRKHKGNFLSKLKQQISFIKELRKEHFELVFDLRTGDRGAIITFLTGAPYRISIFCASEVPFWRNTVFTHLVQPPQSMEEIYGTSEQPFFIINDFGLPLKNKTPKLRVSETVLKRVRQLLIREKIDKVPLWISVNPFSRWHYKELNDDKWVQIIDWLWNENEIATVIMGSKEEKDRVLSISTRCSGRVFNLAGETTLDELAGVLSLSRLHIGVDSAGPHIAAAVGTPTLTIYGPSDWRYWAPQGRDHTIIVPECDCAPCRQKGCNGKGWSRCLEDLDVEKVKIVIKDIIKDF